MLMENLNSVTDLINRYAPASYSRSGYDSKELVDGYHVSIDAPGADRSSIKVTAQEGLLEIQWLRRGSKNNSYQSFYIPRKVDLSKVEASYSDGVIEVKMQKKASAMPVPIEVKIQ